MLLVENKESYKALNLHHYILRSYKHKTFWIEIEIPYNKKF